MKYTEKENTLPEIDYLLERVFRYHPPADGDIRRYKRIRAMAREFCRVVLENTPECRERTIATNKIREAVMWANQGVACNPTTTTTDDVVVVQLNEAMNWVIDPE